MAQGHFKQGVNAGQEGGQGFARTRRGGDERIASGHDRRPARHLNLGGCPKFLMEPLGNDRMEVGQGHEVGIIAQFSPLSGAGASMRMKSRVWIFLEHYVGMMSRGGKGV